MCYLIMMQALYSFIYKANLQKKLRIYSSLINYRLFSSKIKKSSILPREEQILKVANEGTEEELQKHIESPHSKNIILHRIKHGPYKTLFDLLLINKFEHNIAQRFCNSIYPKKMSKLTKYTVMPDIRLRKLPDTVLAIHVGPTLVSWALVDCNFNLLNWDYETWYNSTPRNNSYHLIKLVPDIIKKIPSANIYVMEDIQLIRNTITRNILYLQQQLIVSIMVCIALKDEKCKKSYADNIYVFKPKTTARCFNLLLGSEIVAAQYVVQVTSTSSQIEIHDMTSINICMKNDGKDKYLRGTTDIQEQMRWSLLKAISFFRIAAIRNNLPDNKNIKNISVA